MAGTDASGRRPTKRRRNENQSSWQRKHRQRYGKASGAETRKDLPHGSRGFVVTCNPKHEEQCFREAIVLLGEQVELLYPTLKDRFDAASSTSKRATSSEPRDKGNVVNESSIRNATDISDTPSNGNEPGEGPTATDATANDSNKGHVDVASALAAEVADLRKPSQPVFTRVDWGVQGSVFVRIYEESIEVEKVVEGILRTARKLQTPSCRNCVRFVPIHSTCYAKPEDAGRAATKVVQTYFPKSKSTYAIAFKSRMNTDAHRDDYIKAIASAIEDDRPGMYKVDLEKPVTVLVVEVLRTTCVLGAVPYFYELAKLNVREAAKPEEDVKPKASKQDIPKQKPQEQTDGNLALPNQISQTTQPDGNAEQTTFKEDKSKSDSEKPIDSEPVRHNQTPPPTTGEKPPVDPQQNVSAAQPAPASAANAQSKAAEPPACEEVAENGGSASRQEHDVPDSVAGTNGSS